MGDWQRCLNVSVDKFFKVIFKNFKKCFPVVFLCNKVEVKCFYSECVYPTVERCTKCALLLSFNVAT